MPIYVSFAGVVSSPEQQQPTEMYYTPDHTPSSSRASTGIPLSPRVSGAFSSSSNYVVTGFNQFETPSLPAERSNSRTEPAERSNPRILEKNTQPKNFCCFPFGACCSVGKMEQWQL